MTEYDWANPPPCYHISAVVSTLGFHSFMNHGHVYIIKQQWKHNKYQNIFFAHRLPDDVVSHLAGCHITDTDLFHVLVGSGLGVVSSLMVSAS